jgi:hypothetical protein
VGLESGFPSDRAPSKEARAGTCAALFPRKLIPLQGITAGCRAAPPDHQLPRTRRRHSETRETSFENRILPFGKTCRVSRKSMLVAHPCF